MSTPNPNSPLSLGAAAGGGSAEFGTNLSSATDNSSSNGCTSDGIPKNSCGNAAVATPTMTLFWPDTLRRVDVPVTAQDLLTENPRSPTFSSDPDVSTTTAEGSTTLAPPIALGGGVGVARGSGGLNKRTLVDDWVIGWNPRGLVVVVALVLRACSFAACRRFLSDIKRAANSAPATDDGVTKYLRVLGRLNRDENRRDDLETRNVKSKDDIWMELHDGPVVADLFCCGYRTTVILHVVRFDTHSAYSTTTAVNTPLARLSSLVTSRLNDGDAAAASTASAAKKNPQQLVVLPPGAQSRLEGTILDAHVRKLLQPARRAVSPPAAAMSPHKIDNDDKMSLAQNVSIVGSDAKLSNDSTDKNASMTPVTRDARGGGFARRVQSNLSSPDQDAPPMTSSQLRRPRPTHMKMGSTNSVDTVRTDDERSAPLDDDLSANGSFHQALRHALSHRRGTDSSSSANNSCSVTPTATPAKARRDQAPPNFSLVSAHSASDQALDADADSFESSPLNAHSFTGQVHSEAYIRTTTDMNDIDPAIPPRLSFPTVESYTELSSVFLCCNHTGQLQEVMTLFAANSKKIQQQSKLLPASFAEAQLREEANKKDSKYADSSSDGDGDGNSQRRRAKAVGMDTPAPTSPPLLNHPDSPVMSHFAASENPFHVIASQGRPHDFLLLPVAIANAMTRVLTAVLLPFLGMFRSFSYFVRMLEFRLLQTINAMQILSGQAHACGLHPAIPHSNTGTTRQQQLWCVVNLVFQIAADMALGIGLSILIGYMQGPFLQWVRPLAWFGLYDLHQGYLDWFLGWPGGFKMNDDLNEFLSLFTRGVLSLFRMVVVSTNDTFDWLQVSLDICRFVSYLGVSFALAFVSDCCNVATLHLRNAFHILRVVYVCFRAVIKSVFEQFRGRRINPLRKRIDSFDFEMDQAVLGIFIMTASMFLFPTMGMHYYYLAAVRTSVWVVQESLSALGFILGGLPIGPIVRWCVEKKKPVRGVRVEGVSFNPSSGAIEMRVVTLPVTFAASVFGDFSVLMQIVLNPLKPAKLIAFIVNATSKPSIHARRHIYGHLCADPKHPKLTDF